MSGKFLRVVFTLRKEFSLLFTCEFTHLDAIDEFCPKVVRAILFVRAQKLWYWNIRVLLNETQASSLVLESFDDKHRHQWFAVAENMVLILPQTSLQKTSTVIVAIRFFDRLYFLCFTVQCRSNKCRTNRTGALSIRVVAENFKYSCSKYFRNCTSPGPWLEEVLIWLGDVRCRWLHRHNSTSRRCFSLALCLVYPASC